MLQSYSSKHVTIRVSRLTAQASRLAPRAFFASKKQPIQQKNDELALAKAREWLSKFSPDTIPRNICEVSFSRASGPGGQNVNKVSSKATLRISTTALLSHIPEALHASILKSRFHAPKSGDLVIQADESRKQGENVSACFRKLSELIAMAGREAVPNETSPEQRRRVVALQGADEARRRRMKDFLSARKSARRGDER